MTEQENNDRTKLLLKDESRSRYVLWAAGGVLAALVAGAWYWYQGTQNTNAVKYVTEAVNEYFAPIRERRQRYENDLDYVKDVLHEGNRRANEIAEQTLAEVQDAMGMVY